MKTKFSGILTLLLAFVVQVSLAQTTVSGTVTEENGPLPGANVIVKGTATGTQTDFDGNYSIQASPTDVLIFSFVGYTTKEVTVGNQTTINVGLASDNALEEVIVTAQGIKREKKAVGYAVTTIQSEAIGSRPSTDVARVLQGKAPGVNIQQTSGLAGSGTNIIIRGYSSINGSNQPLFVVDGIPFNTATNSDQGFNSGGNSASSRFLDIDPNNIAEISVLKGLSATTLYGQAGRNGVVLITTKSGSTSGSLQKKFEVSVDQSYFVTEIANLPDYQDTYGNGFYQSYSQAFSNWGPNFDSRGTNGVDENGNVPHPYDRAALADVFPEFQGADYAYRPYDSVEQFFTTGGVTTTSIGVNSSSDKGSYNVSFGRTDEEGFVKTSTYQRINFSAGGSTKLANGLNISSSFNFTRTDRTTPPTAVATGSNPAAGTASLFANVLYTPRSVDLIGLPFQNPVDNSSVYYRAGNDIDNPFWTLNNIQNDERVNRFFTNITASYDISDWFNVSYRVAYDTYSQEQQYGANKGGVQIQGGVLTTSSRINETWDHTLSLNFDKAISDKLNIDGNIGLNPRREVTNLQGVSSNQQFVYGLLTHNNFEESNGFTGFAEQNIIGLYGNVTLGYDNYAYLNLQGRNDWFSSLPQENRAIFYPSASLSLIPTSAFESLKGNDVLNYLKLRVGYGSSAGFPNPYATTIGLGSGTNVFQNQDGGAVNVLTVSNVLGNPDLKPELIQEIEAGIEARLFKNRLSLDVSVYDKVSNDLIIQNRLLDPATGYTVTSDNIGEITNKGIEVGFGIKAIRGEEEGDFNWDINGQWSVNENIVEDNGGEDGSITVFAGFTNLGNAAISGQAFGVIVGSSITRDANNNLVVGSDGNYLVDNNLSVIGDPNADWRSTVINEFSYKGFSLQAQLEYQHGGDMYSTTAAALLARGLTEDTNFDRTQTYILPGVTQDGAPNNIQIAATDVGFVNSGFFIDEQAIYDATSIRLREVSLGYSFPEKLLERTPLGSLRVNFIGQNLWFKAINFPDGLNFDPDVSSTGVGNGQGFDYLTGPTSKRFGFSLNATF
ncbi:SusC/RagA family TonB-linked outer membrane protein [Dokdonia sp. 4H-3-7-5]|uniref:SusC/RagA family TonB-linked outer membrane protein n=1 Tax=Dokdonia sp. (strain 4H-3-7-5) TaxID=983548 RepID=UPI00020A76F4|nr:SusC/RagA family TonB-linked outer membrane protein [Dokdonia sp. 4H-3-7-5]AEE19803.1 TonB-dependent receptor plug [Dokdonia sp. 4H-3-7-5]